MAATGVCRRSTLYLQRWSSSLGATSTPALLLRRRCSQINIQTSLALSSLARNEKADLHPSIKNNNNNNDDDDSDVDEQRFLRKKPTIVRPRASNAHSSRAVKLTPANIQAEPQHHQQHVSASAASPRATCAAHRSSVRVKPVIFDNQSTVVVAGGDYDDAIRMESSAASSLLRQNQQQPKATRQQQQQQPDNNYRPEQQQEQPQHQPYRRHGKITKSNSNNTAANSSSSSPTAIPVPTSCWVQVDGISPLSSLDAILASVQTAVLQQQEQQTNNGGILLDLDGGDTVLGSNNNNGNIDGHPWIERARVILSPFARPTGWLLKFRNLSIVQALLTHAHNNPIQSGWKMVTIKECKDMDNDNKNDKEELVVSDATLRIENCSHDTTTYDLINMFSRFDLAVPRRLSCSSFPSVQEWQGGTTPEGKLAPPGTFLVHFADASWARAALREKQGLVFKGRQLRLAQYPRQI